MSEALLWDRKQAAEALGIGQTLLEQLTAREQIPCVRLNRRVLYPVDGLRRWVEGRTNWPDDGPPFPRVAAIG